MKTEYQLIRWSKEGHKEGRNRAKTILLLSSAESFGYDDIEASK